MKEQISKEEKVKEAVQRMRRLKLLPNIIREFEKQGVLYYSEYMGILYWVSNKPEWADRIKAFEKRHSALVYHAVFCRLEFGDCLSLFYISDHKEEWELDNNDLLEGYACTYTINLDDELCSEFGSIGFRSMCGGVKRVA
ncbi:MAG: hypothetical protein FWD58_08125 [Firmicutes bacterium]|nr:hypothetical protein [Bacillota bacterium]